MRTVLLDLQSMMLYLQPDVDPSVHCRVSLRPRHPIFLHHLDITHLAELVVQPFGYLKSPPVQVPALRKAAETSLGGSSRYRHHYAQNHVNE